MAPICGLGAAAGQEALHRLTSAPTSGSYDGQNGRPMTRRNPGAWMWGEAVDLLEQAERLQRQFFRLAGAADQHNDVVTPTRPGRARPTVGRAGRRQ